MTDRNSSAIEGKTCVVCKETLSLDMFCKKSKNKDGKATVCRKCVKAYSAQYYQKKKVENGNILADIAQKGFDTETRRCLDCNTDKTLDCFSISISNTKLVKSYCRDCDNKRQRSRRKSPGFKRQPTYKDKLRSVRKRYKITDAEYLAIMHRQGSVCASCGGPPTAGRWFLDVDHDHVSGVVRGLLCSKCNAALGLLNDDLDRIDGLRTYLSSYLSQRETEEVAS